jgi:hypothetical protein
MNSLFFFCFLEKGFEVVFEGVLAIGWLINAVFFGHPCW